MKRALQRVTSATYYFIDGERVEGVPGGITGNLGDITGDLGDITGDLTGIRGDLSGIWGDLSGITGNLGDITGDLDACEITPEERENGVNVADLVGE